MRRKSAKTFKVSVSISSKSFFSACSTVICHRFKGRKMGRKKQISYRNMWVRKCGVEGVEGAVQISGLKHISDFNCYPPHRLHATCTASCPHEFYVESVLLNGSHPTRIHQILNL